MNKFRQKAANDEKWSVNTFRRLTLAATLFIYILVWSGGIASHWLFGGVNADEAWLGTIFLFLAGMIVLISARSKREIALFAGFASIGFVAEVVGVRWGFPFGSYVYTDALGFKLFGVPAVMAFAWVTLILFVRELLLPLKMTRWIEAAAAGVCITAIDLVIDPLAVNQLGYWKWDQGGDYFGIPATNFAGWFLTGFLAFLFFQRRTSSNLWPLRVGQSIIVFFTLIALIYKIYLIGLIGCVLCLPYFFVVYHLKKNNESKSNN